MIDLAYKIDLRPTKGKCQHYKALKIPHTRTVASEDFPDRLEMPEGIEVEIKITIVVCFDCNSILAAGWEYNVVE